MLPLCGSTAMPMSGSPSRARSTRLEPRLPSDGSATKPVPSPTSSWSPLVAVPVTVCGAGARPFTAGPEGRPFGAGASLTAAFASMTMSSAPAASNVTEAGEAGVAGSATGPRSSSATPTMCVAPAASTTMRARAPGT